MNDIRTFTAHEKHVILTHYAARSRGQSAHTIASLHGMKGGRATLLNWYRRWNGTAASLQRRPVHGRPRVLSPTQVEQHVLDL